MAVAGRNRLRVSVYVESATPHEVTLAMAALLHWVVPEAPQNLVADNAYDSARLDGGLGSTVLNSSLRIARIERTRPNIDAG